MDTRSRVERCLAEHPILTILPVLAVTAVIVAAEWRTRREDGEQSFAVRPLRPFSSERVVLRLWGFVVTLALVALGYWLFPEYSGDFYRPYWNFLKTLAPLLPLVPVYLLWADRRVHIVDDELLESGQVMSGNWLAVDARLIRRHLLGWVIKAFFLPLMTSTSFRAAIGPWELWASVDYG